MEYTGNDMQDDTHLSSSSLKTFSLFEISLSCGDDNLDTFSIKFINCEKETGLKSKTGFKDFYDEVITQSLLNAMLNHVGMSLIFSSKKEMDYDNFTKSKNLNRIDTGPWKNKNICSKLYRTTFESFINKLEQTDIISCVL